VRTAAQQSRAKKKKAEDGSASLRALHYRLEEANRLGYSAQFTSKTHLHRNIFYFL
jgi:hypothetical protein